MPVTIFFCYAREDEALLNKLKTHLRPLQRQGLIDVWHDLFLLTFFLRTTEQINAFLRK